MNLATVTWTVLPTLLVLALASVACSSDAVPQAPTVASGLCHAGTKSCGGRCVDALDPLYGCRADACAACEAREASLLACSGEACRIELCRASFGDCDGRFDNGCETDLLDPRSCGACATTCSENESCSRRGCGPCASDETACKRRCVDLLTDTKNCGACETVCPAGPNGVAKCKSGKCSLKCDAGFGDCDNDPTNGCEPLAPYYRDADGDGHGVGAEAGRACKPPSGHAGVAGDCADQDSRAYPGQTQFFTAPRAGGIGSDVGASSLDASFDFDCDGAETASPDGVEGQCAPSTCLAGFAPAPARGPGTNAYCGSTTKFTCFGAGASSCAMAVAPAWACR